MSSSDSNDGLPVAEQSPGGVELAATKVGVVGSGSGVSTSEGRVTVAVELAGGADA
jgi:hypothetical protein